MTDSTNLGVLNLFQEFKAVGEFAKFAGTAWSWQMLPRTRRPRPILLIPGFLAGDVTLYPFANWLRSRGHQVFFSGMLTNADCPRRTIIRLARMLQTLSDRFDDKIVVIGHSLGGIYARELARRYPEAIEQTILLGTPIQQGGMGANPIVRMLASLTMGVHQKARGCACELINVCGVHSATTPPRVAQSIIFSKADGVVDWVTCLETGPNVRTFEVDSTHIGLPYSLDTLRIVYHLIEDGPDGLGKVAAEVH